MIRRYQNQPPFRAVVEIMDSMTEGENQHWWAWVPKA